ncbi:NADH-ubiquinone oxidoreductase complex I, 21 kDa subunit-domain-containing protein, partial [Infundibulicybe gibba]
RDPHASRVVRYFRPSDYAVWAGATAAFPSALYLWDMADPAKYRLRTALRLGGFLGFMGGFLLAYQRSSEAKEGKPLYGESHQPMWVQGSAYRNSAFSQLKFCAFNFVNHPHHGTDPAKYGVKTEGSTE